MKKEKEEGTEREREKRKRQSWESRGRKREDGTFFYLAVTGEGKGREGVRVGEGGQSGVYKNNLFKWQPNTSQPVNWSTSVNY